MLAFNELASASNEYLNAFYKINFFHYKYSIELRMKCNFLISCRFFFFFFAAHVVPCTHGHVSFLRTACIRYVKESGAYTTHMLNGPQINVDTYGFMALLRTDGSVCRNKIMNTQCLKWFDRPSPKQMEPLKSHNMNTIFVKVDIIDR